MNNQLTKEIAFKELHDFFQEKPFVLFGTGMSCAVNNVFGMNSLMKYLLKEVPTKNKLNKAQENDWDALKEALNNGDDFENAMNNVKNKELISVIVEHSGKFIAEQDYIYSLKILTGEINWPATGLFKKLVDGLSGTDRELHVATPNYDMIAENAFYQNDIPYINGFWGGLAKSLDWRQSKRAITYVEKTITGKTKKSITKQKKHISFYKVHGSLNLFNLNDSLFENNSWIYNKPEGVERLIITPGISKYEKLHQYRSELLGKYDNAIEKHNFFLFLGFGFNDNQLNTNAIITKLKKEESNGLIITKHTNEKIEDLLKKAKNLWLVCSLDGNSGTMIKNSKYTNELILKNNKLWKVDIFTKTILGN